MAEFKLGRIRFVWKGEWAGSTTYYKDDVVKYGGKTFICAVGHTSDADFYTDLNVVPSKWSQMTDGQEWKGDWTTATFYKVGDIVKYGGSIYIANTAHTSAATATLGLEDDTAKWTTYAEGLDQKGSWSTTTRYKVNDVVRYGGVTYICNEGHTSAATAALGLETDQSKWDAFNEGLEYRGVWIGSTRYKKNDIVKYGAGLQICTTGHTADASDFTADTANWSAFIEGFEFANDWSAVANYRPGDVVKYGGNQYVAKTSHSGATPSNLGAQWALFAEGFSFQSAWDNTTDYKIGEVVTNNGYSYVAIADSASVVKTITATTSGTARFTTDDTTNIAVGQSIQFSGTTFGNVNDGNFYFIKSIESATQFTISTVHGGTTFTPTTGAGTMAAQVAAHPTEPNYWAKLSEGISWQGEWTDDTEYEVGDAVRFGANAFICVNRHRSEGDDGSTIGAEGGGAANSRPDQDITGTYWNQLMTGSETAILTTPGDLVYFGGSGVARLPIGVEGQVLQAGANYPEWTSLGASDHVYFVAPHGTDGPYPINGATLDKPFKTIRYACEAVEHGPRNPNAQRLLEMNRPFIQREVTEWINYQIEYFTTTAPDVTSPWYNFTYKDDRCSRDIGFIVDALIHDLGHGGNVKMRGAANAYVSALFESENMEYARLAEEGTQDVLANNYMLSVVQNVLNQTDPSVNYQTTNGDLSTAVIEQWKDSSITAENVYSTVASLVTIVNNALEDGNASRIPARYQPNNLIKIKTGRYRETLPIIVPENTCVIGDEVRSVNAGAAGSLVHKTDSSFSLSTFEHLKGVLSDIVVGNSVTPTSGNAESQDIAVPFAGSVEQAEIDKLVDTMMHNVDFRTGNLDLGVSADPTGYNTSYLAGYGDARHLIFENKEYFKVELTTWINTNYPLIKYSRTKCKQDVGYIVDALVYDLTYGGYKLSTEAALAYYDGVAGGLAIDSSEKTATIAAYVYLKDMMQDVAANTLRTSLQSTIPQYRATAGSANAVTHIGNAMDIIVDTVTNVADRPNVTVTDIASNVCTTATAHGLNVGDAFVARSTENGFVKNQTYWVASTPAGNTFTVSETWGGSTKTLTNGTGLTIVGDKWNLPAATNAVTTTTALITAAQTLDAAQESIVTAVVEALGSTNYHYDFTVRESGLTTTEFTIYVGTGPYAHTYVSGGKVTNSSGTEFTVSNFVWSHTTGLATVTTSSAHGLEAGDVVDIEEITVSCIGSSGPVQYVFPNAVSTDSAVNKVLYNQTKCLRDVRYLTEAVMYDFMFDSNLRTLKSAYSYLRATASDVYNLNQKATTRSAFAVVKEQAKANVGGDATAQARIESLMDSLDSIVYGGSTEGSRCATELRNADYASLQLERNRDFIVAEASAYIENTWGDTGTATSAVNNAITISDTGWLKRGLAVKFTGTVLSVPSTVGGDGIVAGDTYYVHKILSSTEFTISKLRNASTEMPLDNDTGSMAVRMSYNSALCLRDVNRVIDAIKYDIKFKGNYKTLFAARYYGNAVVGSHEEDMYYLRNGTGVRNQTLADLQGDLLPANSYGTSRVSAGAYCSLDPGWGPEDYRTWITERSPYIQNVCTFGTAAVGQKIDGALHNGGNDSMVSNDFTQVISDGIGAWVTNNGRAELVSVFTYYSHVGYLSENGGRIRGTNGNNSYGDFGSVAEGFDDTETPNTAIVDNKFQFEATVSEVNTDGAVKVYNFEFDNAGNEYSYADFLVSGAGTGARVKGNETRNGAVHQVFLKDLVDDSTSAPEAAGNFGGFGYVSNSNTAQAGSTTSITLAATDGELSSAYVGMKVVVTGGTGVGQYGIIASYNSGTKIANVTKESDGTSGWDHWLVGTTIVSPDASSTYTVEPRVEFTAPTFSSQTVVPGLPTSGDWTDSIFGATTGVYLPTSTGGNGTGATFQVIKNGFKYSVSIIAGGTGYQRFDTITIDGSDVGGESGTNDITITVTSINSSTGAVLNIDTEGYGQEGIWVAVRSGSANGAYTKTGNSWVTSSMPTSASWTKVAHGLIDDGSTIALQSRFVAIASGGTTAAYSDDGITWLGATLPASATWVDVAYGEGRFVAIANDSTTVAISLDGLVWDLTGTLPTTGYTAIAYGDEQFVAVRSGTTNAAYSTLGDTWTAASLPASSAWSSIAFGDGVYVVTATDSDNAAISHDGDSWATASIGAPDSTTPSGIQKVAYGDGVFMVTAYQAAVNGFDYVATSDDGRVWTWHGIGSGDISTNSGYNAVAHGVYNRKGYWVVIGKDTGQLQVRVRAGATAKGRAYVAENKIYKVTITEPGSGYDAAPTMTITDPSEIYAVPFEVRIGNGVLANPTFYSRGTGYVSASADLIAGDGYADFFQSGPYIAVRRLTQVPIAGSNVVFGHLPNETFKLVNIYTLLGSNDGSFTCFLQVSPEMKLINVPPHGTSVTTRIKYSQVRLTGHDFLDIGTGNFVETNYPGLPTQDPVPAQETRERNGGRVFYTSTDQDGNFRVGGLFAVEQSTGVATLNADAFNIAGLQELTLGEVTLGGGSASIDEFSTDPFFTADSDSVVPTQRAIKAYISSQIGGGGASLNVNSVTAGFIYIAGTQITTTTNASISINANLNFKGGVVGLPLSWNYFLNK